MNLQLFRSILIIVFTFLLVPGNVVTAGELDEASRQETINRIQEAFVLQVSLTEETRTLDEMTQILSSHFTGDFITAYLKENAQRFEDKYIVYATDFPTLTIPFFTYDNNTKVIQKDNEQIIYEFFPATDEGPVAYDDHYEVVVLHQLNGKWMVNTIKIQPESPNVSNDSEEKKEMTQHRDEKSLSLSSLLSGKGFYLQTKNILHQYFHTTQLKAIKMQINTI